MATTLAFVRQLPGILDIEGDLNTQTLTVTYDTSQVSKDEIVQTIENLGYTVSNDFDIAEGGD